jgi:hypothetical protein
MVDPAIGEISMRATVEWFEEKEFHCYTLMLHTQTEEKRARVRQMWLRAGLDRSRRT